MPRHKRDEEGVSRRKCKGCGKVYSYPEVQGAATGGRLREAQSRMPGWAATRFHCGPCAALPKPIRATFEQLTRRINQLEKKSAPKK